MPVATAPRTRSACRGGSHSDESEGGLWLAHGRNSDSGSAETRTSMLCRTKLGPICRKTIEWKLTASTHTLAWKMSSAQLNAGLSSRPSGAKNSRARLPQLMSLSPKGRCSSTSLSMGTDARACMEHEASTMSSIIHDPLSWRSRPM